MNVRHLIRLFLVGILIFTLASCSVKKETEPDENSPRQTLLFYFVGTSLNSHLSNNREAIKAALNYDIQGKSRVLVFHQKRSKNQGDIIEMTYKDGLCQEELLTTINLPAKMNDEELGNIFSRMMEYAPADSYSLIIGSHGRGWIPIDADPGGSISAWGSKRIPTHEEMWQIDENPITRFIGDGSSNLENSFDIPTLSKAITSTGVKLEYILFDACFMSNIESLYDLRYNAKYIIGSTCEIMGAGFPYLKIMPLMLKDYGKSYDLKSICETFYLDYKDDETYPSGAVALIDCSQLDALAKAMKAVNSATKKDYNLADIQSYERQTNHVFFDLGDYVNAMCDDNAVKQAFNSQLDKCIVVKYAPTQFYSAFPASNRGICDITSFCGVSTSAPSVLYRDAYVETAWYKATN